MALDMLWRLIISIVFICLRYFMNKIYIPLELFLPSIHRNQLYVIWHVNARRNEKAHSHLT